MSKSYFHENLRYLRSSKNLTQEDLATETGISRVNIGKWETSTTPNKKSLEILAKYFDVPLIDLLYSDLMGAVTGIAHSTEKQVIPLGKHAHNRLKENEYSEAYSEWKGLPMYNAPITATFVETYRDKAIYQPQYYLHDPRFKDCDFGAVITGDSMHSEIRHGDFVACKEVLDKSFIVYGEIYYVVAHNGLETCKYINAGRSEDELLLVPRNEKISPSPIKKEMIKSLFKVRGIVRGY